MFGISLCVICARLAGGCVCMHCSYNSALASFCVYFWITKGEIHFGIRCINKRGHFYAIYVMKPAASPCLCRRLCLWLFSSWNSLEYWLSDSALKFEMVWMSPLRTAVWDGPCAPGAGSHGASSADSKTQHLSYVTKILPESLNRVRDQGLQTKRMRGLISNKRLNGCNVWKKVTLVLLPFYANNFRLIIICKRGRKNNSANQTWILFGFETTASNLKFVCLLKLKFHNIPRQCKHSMEIGPPPLTPTVPPQTFPMSRLHLRSGAVKRNREWIWQNPPKQQKRLIFGHMGCLILLALYKHWFCPSGGGVRQWLEETPPVARHYELFKGSQPAKRRKNIFRLILPPISLSAKVLQSHFAV